MFGELEAIDNVTNETFENQNNKIAGIVEELNTIFSGSGINPDTQISGSAENGFSIQGGTFLADSTVHAGLAQELDNIYARGSNDGDISGGIEGSKEVMVLKKINKSVSKTKDEFSNLSTMVQQKIQNLDSLKSMLEKSFNRLYEIAKKDDSDTITKQNIHSVQTKLMLEFDRQLGVLQNILKVNIKPTEKDLLSLLKKNADFTTLAETLGVAYGDETASDRLALVFTNLNDVSIMANKVKSALSDLNISLSEYKNIKNSKELSDALYSVFKKFNNKKLDSSTDLKKILEAMDILKGAQSSHEDILKELRLTGRGENEEINGSNEIDGGDEVEGGDYTTGVGRRVKTRLKSTLSKRVDTYQKTMKELYRSFMNQVNSKFKELVALIELLTSKVGSEIAYDEDLKDFISMFLGFNEDISNEKIFYSLINLDNTVAGQGLRARFLDTLDKIIASCKTLNDYSLFKDISKQLNSLKELVDTMSDTVINLKKEEEKKGSSDFMWTDKLVEQSFSMNNINLIKQSIKKLAFYGKTVSIKENLHRMNKEQKLYQEDYDKLLGKSIGLKLTEIQKEYVENVDRLNDKTRGRGKMLEEHNAKASADKQLPRGLVETIYKLQYEAKDGLYRSLEAIDLYLMYFTENLSANPEAIMDLNKMLEQTDIIAKWFTKKSVDNVIELLDNHIDAVGTPTSTTIETAVNLPTIVVNSPLVQDKIKIAFERTKKCIDSIAILKNIISMFIHLGEKYGNVNLTEKLNISPNMIYKHLVKYIWVSAFTMGYGTAGGDRTKPTGDTVPKSHYEPETGDFESFFDIVFTTIILPLDVFNEVESAIKPKLENIIKNSTNATEVNDANTILNRIKKDIFMIDDKYFILGIKAMIGKIFTVIDTNTLLSSPDKLANMMRNPVRMIIGASDVQIIPDAIELYIRLPLLVEFYKSIFEDGNQNYKNNSFKDNETEVIAFIPELGTVWSGLIQCIFDESKYIKDGIYSISNMKDIVREVNKIYNSYKSKPKDKLVRIVVLDLIAEINRRYGILKQKDIAEFYQVRKKYTKNTTDLPLNDSVNFDILDENNDYERSGPSAQYVESSFNKFSNDSLIFTDIKLVRDFRNKIYDSLFGGKIDLNDLSSKSFNEKIKYYKQQIVNCESVDSKFELIAQAIDQSSNINAQNVNNYLLFHELVVNPLEIIMGMFNTTQNNIVHVNKSINDNNKLAIIDKLYTYFNDNILFKVKTISNTKIIIDFTSFQTVSEMYIENIKYMLSKFRTLICKPLITISEDLLYKYENLLINVTIKNDSSAENYNESLTIDGLNVSINNVFSNNSILTDGKSMYERIMFDFNKIDENGNLLNVQTVENVTRDKFDILRDVNQTFDSAKRAWTTKPSTRYTNLVMPDLSIITNKSFIHKSILQKYNMLVFQFLHQMYNSATKKIYTKLIDEFANKAMSAVIFEYGGIPDMTETNSNPLLGPIDNGLINNPSAVLSSTNVTILRTLLTRTLNVQLPVKYHLLDTINEVSTVQIEKYKAYLPIFITYFEHLIEECIVYKKLLENNDLIQLQNMTLQAQPTEQYKGVITDDYNMAINYTTELIQPVDQSEYKLQYHEVLNGIVNGSRALITDMTNVLNELNYIPQFGNIQDNFIKNFYNNNRELPYTPLSIVTMVMKYKDASTAVPNPEGMKLNLLPTHYINSDTNKFIYGTNAILNTKNESDDVNNYLWLKEQIKSHNNSTLSTNTIEANKINQFLTNTKSFLQYAYICNHVHHNLWYKINDKKNEPVALDKTTPITVTLSEFYFNDKSLNSVINIIENQLSENKKHQIVGEIVTRCGSSPKQNSLAKYSLDRKNAQILNVIDLNVNPINVHALMREIPLVNVYNYAFTFDNIIKSFIYNVTPEDAYTKPSITLDKGNESKYYLSCLLQDPYFVDYKQNGANHSKSLTTLLSTTLIPTASADYDRDSSLYLNTPKYSSNVLEMLTKSSKTSNTLIENNKFLRNIAFLVNCQRVIRLKIKRALYRIHSNVVSNNNIVNMHITDYSSGSDGQPKDDEFEITELF